MVDAFAKIRAGQKLPGIPAQAWNSFLDSDAWVKQQQASNNVPPASGGLFNSTVVRVLNDSGATVDRFGVLGIDAPIIEPADNLAEFQARIMLSCSTPDEALHVGKFVVLLEPLADGAIGRAVISGAVQVLLDVVDEDDQWAEMDDGEDEKLKAAVYGSARILCKESGTGDKQAIVLLGAGIGFSHAGIAKATSGIGARSGTTPGSATCDLFRLDSGTLTDTTRDATIYNLAESAVTSGAYIQYKADSAGVLWVDFEDCGT